jgi:hypothetical protein
MEKLQARVNRLSMSSELPPALPFSYSVRETVRKGVVGW